MTGNELRRQRFMRELYEWPKRDGTRGVHGHIWTFKNGIAYSGNVVVTREEWQKEHYREVESA